MCVYIAYYHRTVAVNITPGPGAFTVRACML